VVLRESPCELCNNIEDFSVVFIIIFGGNTVVVIA